MGTESAGTIASGTLWRLVTCTFLHDVLAHVGERIYPPACSACANEDGWQR
jgi:hypothetical protein